MTPRTENINDFKKFDQMIKGWSMLEKTPKLIKHKSKQLEKIQRT